MRTNSLPCLLAAMLSGASAQMPAAPPVRPNIVVVFMDDMGYGDIAPFGSTTSRTPALDRMAREGTRLTSFYAAPLYGGKGSTWEGGVRVPTLAWWPGHVKAGRSTDAVAGTIDLLPTFVSLAGGKLPDDRPIDGADISKLLTGESNESAREAHYFYQGYKLEAVRAGGWKLALGPQNLSMGIKEGGVHTPGLRLYNLEQDIGESKDVAAQNPEQVGKLKTLADRMVASLGEGPQGPGVRPPGRVAHQQPLYPMIEPARKAANKPRRAGQ